MADWRNPEAYSYTEKLSPHEWAWEFLRRSAAYRDLWEEYRATLDSLPDRPSRDEIIALSLRLGQRRPSFADFGLRQPADPDLPAPDAFVVWKHRVKVHTISVYGARDFAEPWQGFPWTVNLEFDLALPVEPQLEAARTEFLRHQEFVLEKGLIEPISPLDQKPRRGQFVIYLRLLDAQAEGAAKNEMGRVLFPEAGEPGRSARLTLKTAIEMAEGGYRQLLLEHEP